MTGGVWVMIKLYFFMLSHIKSGAEIRPVIPVGDKSSSGLSSHFSLLSLRSFLSILTVLVSLQWYIKYAVTRSKAMLCNISINYLQALLSELCRGTEA